MKTPWQEVPLGEFLIPVREPVTVDNKKEYKQITVSLHGRGVRLRQMIMGAAIKTKNQYQAKAGRFIYSRIDARNGAFGIIPEELDGAVISGDFPTFDFDRRKVVPRFFEYMTKTVSFEEMCLSPSKGVTNRKRLKEAELLSFNFSLPILPEQERIVEKIEQVATRIKKVKHLSEEIDREQAVLLIRRVQELSKDAPRVPMGEIAPVVRRPVDVEPDKWYPELGIRSFGKGTFHKASIKGSEVGNKPLFHIMPGDLLISQVFAWESAIAVVQPHDKGRFGSHRFITCVTDAERATPEYLC